MCPKLLLATNNIGKVREYRNLLLGIPFELVTPVEIGIDTVVEEKGTTFEENARLKACALAKESGLLTLADDSGLEVDALNGEPGVMSARYAGENANDAKRVNFLLSKLKGIPKEKRNARFRCVIAIAQPDGEVAFCDGECAGMIAFEPCGKNGFGYDPIFCFPKYGKTMAELPIEVKNRISHRGRAAQKARLVLQKMADK
ncbi:MAG: XTP/dITP diphosphatase [Dehalococcoidales bacterium]|nr:XTP/dITP diphosphatase [Dehalococcoidales bacterium]